MKKRLTIYLCLIWFVAPVLAGVANESRHFLTTEVGLGYSALLNKSDLGKSSGLAGAKLQIGYEWNYRRFLLHTGLEFASINDRARVAPFTLETPYTIGLPSGLQMTEHFNFQSYQETQMMGQFRIPIQLGGWFAERYYFLAGLRVGVPVLRSGRVKTDVTTTLTDPMLIGELGDVAQHDAYASTERFSTKWSGMIDAQVSAEIGVVLNSFFEKPKGKGKGKGASHSKQPEKKPILYRVGLFADYGVTSCVTYPTGDPLVTVSAPREITPSSYFFASQTGAHSLLVGAKFAVLFQLNQPKPQKAEPSYLEISVTDVATSEPLTAKVDIFDQKKKRTVTRDAKNGRLRYRTRQGDYTITAYNAAYYSQSESASITEDGVTIPIELALQARPWLRLRVTNADTGEPLAVAIMLRDAQSGDSVSLLQTSAEEGLARILLDEKRSYKLAIEQTGYETLARGITNVGDSLNLVLTPIKVGKKVVLHNLFFATNKTRILPQSEPALDELYEFLRDNPSLTIRITGHTDNVGSDRDNQILSEGRAQAVRDEIIKRGIAPERIEAEGKGESEPIDTNETEEGRARNRRVEFTITSTGGALIEQMKE